MIKVNRPVERLQEALTILVLALQVLDFDTYLASLILYGLWALGGIREGIRLIQYPSMLGFLVFQFNMCGRLSVSIFALGFVVYEALTAVYGRGDYSHYPDCPEAPYDCGYKEGRSSKYGN